MRSGFPPAWVRFRPYLNQNESDIYIHVMNDDCFYYHSWRNNVVIAFGTLSSFLT